MMFQKKKLTAKKLTGGALKLLVIVIVGAFLALHSINLFTFVFPVDQQYLAWLGFGLTGGGALCYLYMFLWEADTLTRKWISLVMTSICSLGEVLAAIFGMQIETWKKAGFSLTENDFQTMLIVIGILAIFHFIALIGYFAGDKIAELFADDDGDGTPNVVDPDWKPKNQNNSSNNNHQHPVWDLAGLLLALKMSNQQAETLAQRGDVNQFYNSLKSYGIEKIDISRKNFNALYHQLKQGQGQVNP